MGSFFAPYDSRMPEAQVQHRRCSWIITGRAVNLQVNSFPFWIQGKGYPGGHGTSWASDCWISFVRRRTSIQQRTAYCSQKFTSFVKQFAVNIISLSTHRCYHHLSFGESVLFSSRYSTESICYCLWGVSIPTHSGI